LILLLIAGSSDWMDLVAGGEFRAKKAGRGENGTSLFVTIGSRHGLPRN
jgi:hypothetical protein